MLRKGEIMTTGQTITMWLGFAWGLSGINGVVTLAILDIIPKLRNRPSKMQRWTKWMVFTIVAFLGLLFATMISAAITAS